LKFDIENSEGLKLEGKYDGYGDAQLVIYLDSIAYAAIRRVDSLEEIDLKKVAYWVEGTYYDGCYKSSAYTPGYYAKENFVKEAD